MTLRTILNESKWNGKDIKVLRKAINKNNKILADYTMINNIGHIDKIDVSNYLKTFYDIEITITHSMFLRVSKFYIKNILSKFNLPRM
jgi:hypothetical protein